MTTPRLRPLQVETGEIVEISQRPKDGYVDVTALCHAANKQYGHWYDRKRTKRFLASLGAGIGIPISELIQVVRGAGGGQHTFAHPKVATSIAMWCSPEFEAVSRCGEPAGAAPSNEGTPAA